MRDVIKAQWLEELGGSQYGGSGDRMHTTNFVEFHPGELVIRQMGNF
jgi:hypothetical protein